jgi:methanogenic corrinoid protein MtbC1
MIYGIKIHRLYEGIKMNDKDMDERLERAIISYDLNGIRDIAQSVLDLGLDPVEAINKGLVPGMNIIGDKFNRKEIFLPQVLVAAKVMYGGLDVLLPAIPMSDMSDMKKCGTAVVEGDVHDIGKNIVKAMLTAGGYTVVDLGKDVPKSMILRTIVDEKLNAICLSTLMTPTLESMREDVKALRNIKANPIVTIGGPPTDGGFAEEIGADHRDESAQDCVKWLHANI